MHPESNGSHYAPASAASSRREQMFSNWVARTRRAISTKPHRLAFSKGSTISAGDFREPESDVYSARSVCAGSIAVVRRAGMRLATKDTTRSPQPTDANTAASKGFTSNSIDCIISLHQGQLPNQLSFRSELAPSPVAKPIVSHPAVARRAPGAPQFRSSLCRRIRDDTI